MKTTAFTALFAAVLAVMTVEAHLNAQPAVSGSMQRRHHAKRAAQIQEQQNLEKRGIFSGQATWYAVSSGDMGACGTNLDPNDKFVALNQGQYGSLNAQSSYCGKTITITNGVKTTTAKILDACPQTPGACAYGALDMSRTLFSYFNDFGVGVFPMKWWINGEGGDDDSSSNNNSNNSSNSNNDNNDDDAEKQREADAAAAKKAAADKKEKEQEEKEAAEKKAAAEKKKKEEEEKKKKEEAKKKAAAAKVEKAQNQNIASFGEIMQTLNQLVEDAQDGSSSASAPSAPAATDAPAAPTDSAAAAPAATTATA